MIISVLCTQNIVPLHNQVPCLVGVWWSGDKTLSILYLVPSDRGVRSYAQFGCFFIMEREPMLFPKLVWTCYWRKKTPAPPLSLDIVIFHTTAICCFCFHSVILKWFLFCIHWFFNVANFIYSFLFNTWLTERLVLRDYSRKVVLY